MISALQICKQYGDIVALQDVNLTVKRSEIAGILGPNGAGKTTLFKILTGLLTPSSGSFDIDSNKPKQIGAIIENPHLYEYLNAKRNLKVFAEYQSLKLQDTDLEEILNLVGLDPKRNDQVKNYSLGMKQRLGIAIALLNQPDALILDEPFLGLDPMGMKDLREMLQKLAKEQHMAILISSHQLEELSKVCEQLHLLSNGKITTSGDTADILHKATQQYRIVGKRIAQSTLLHNIEYELVGDLILFKATQKEAKELLTHLINEGYEIEEFGPELNLEDLYQSS
jgi:ABC-2 type transport system ATP-binding protein